MRRTLSIFAALSLFIGACVGAGDTAPTLSTVATTAPTTSTTARTTPSTPTRNTQPPTTTTTIEESSALGESPARCTLPERYTISYPSDWWVNDGSVTDECGLFGPEPLELEPATDVNAPINLFIDPVSFGDAAAPSDASVDLDRAVTTIDGARTVRLVRESQEGLLPEGTESTTYIVDLSTPEDRTLFLTTSDVGEYDYDHNVDVMDAMARTLDLSIDPAPGLVASYRGGGAPFDVVATARGAEVCFTVAPPGDTTCLSQRSDSDPAVVGATADGVAFGLARPDAFEIQAVDGVAFLPVPIAHSEALGWAIPVDGPTELIGLDDLGREVGSITVGTE